MIQTPRTRKLSFTAILTCSVLFLTAALVSCSKGDGKVTDNGGSNSESVVQAHVDAMAKYDLEADCLLQSPKAKESMAAFDGVEVEDYCKTATKDVMAAADKVTRDRNRKDYTDAAIRKLDKAPSDVSHAGVNTNGTWFEVKSKDKSFTEFVQTVKAKDRWWIGKTLTAEDHDDEDQ